jgi:hypothetical protein
MMLLFSSSVGTHRMRMLVAGVMTLCLASAAGASETASPQAIEYFEQHVRPVLAEQCQRCHGAKTQQSGLRLDVRDAILQGGNSGPAVVPGRPDESRLIRAIVG